MEYAISTDRLNDDGDLWDAMETDPTLDRCLPAHLPLQLAPAEGRPPASTGAAALSTKCFHEGVPVRWSICAGEHLAVHGGAPLSDVAL